MVAKAVRLIPMDHWLKASTLIVLALGNSCLTASAAAPTLYVDRRRHALKVVADGGKVLLNSPIGIGRGGLRRKQSMADDVTPTGTFNVDVILTADPKLNAIDPETARRFERDKDYAVYLKDGNGLARLFGNMNNLDFDGNGKSDTAYGIAYIGIDGRGTGPKMSRFKNVVRWFSIALHGTPHEAADLGKNKSGGCIHLPAAVLKRLLSEKLVTVGTRVIVLDSRDEKRAPRKPPG